MGLVALSLGAMLLPDAWTGKLISLVQVIVPFQHGAAVVGDSVSRFFSIDGPAVSREQYETVERRRLALEHQVAALSMRAAELEREVKLLTSTRQWDLDGGRIGTQGRLVPASVITDDLLSWRSSRLINAGTLQGVRRGAAVTSNLFTVDRGEDAGVQSGMAVVLQEAFLGLVEQVGTHTARVKLLSDLTVEMKVRIGRFDDGGFVPRRRYFWLTGRGHGLMQIRDVDRRNVQAGEIGLGDIVLADSLSDLVPAAMVIGRITAVEPDYDNPLLSILTVRSEVDLDSLTRVYVYDPSP